MKKKVVITWWPMCVPHTRTEEKALRKLRPNEKNPSISKKTGVIKCNYFTWFVKWIDRLAENFDCWKTLEMDVRAHSSDKELTRGTLNGRVNCTNAHREYNIDFFFVLFFKRCTHISFCFYRNYSYAIVSLGHHSSLCKCLFFLQNNVL